MIQITSFRVDNFLQKWDIWWDNSNKFVPKKNTFTLVIAILVNCYISESSFFMNQYCD